MKTVMKICIPIIIISVVVIIAVESISELDSRGNFAVAVTDAFKPYGSEIEDVHVDYGYVAIYIDAKRWKNTSEETQQQFLKEAYILVRSAAISSKIMKHHDCLLSVYDSTGNRIVMYEVKE